MADRGTYRAIKVVFLDGPDFQQLPERARWVFLTLKMSLGPSGIEMHYPEALVHNISARTGADPDDVRSSLGVLEEHAWIVPPRRSPAAPSMAGSSRRSGRTLPGGFAAALGSRPP